MCGLAGRFHPAALPPAPGWAERADALLAHRGPDGSGRYADAHAELVHRRLAVIDLSLTGAQPLSNEDGSVLTVFNGEIYNHGELRHQLARAGHRFQGTSDGEVLAHLYEDEGAAMVTRLRGIFAFALYDRRQRTVVLARDRYGVKPLFYTQVDGQWLFASELKAILALPGYQPRLDRQACYDFLGLGYVPEPATGFLDVHALPPGTCLTLAANGARPVAYHKVTAAPDPGCSLDGAVASLAAALPEAVASQSRADVPVAALLSGGIDSSLVVAAYGRATGKTATTFNVRFPDPRHDETAHALAVRTRYATTHHTIDLADWALTPDAVLSLIRHFDQPFADTSCIPMYWIARGIRERGIICTLSGDGGDEVFGGYPKFWRANALVRLMELPRWLRRAAGHTGRFLAARTRDWGRRVAKAVRLAEAGRSDAAILLAGLSTYLGEDEKTDLVLAPATEALEPVYRHFDHFQPPAARDLEDLSGRMTETQFTVGLPSDMLRKVDMMSMRAGIEVRVPLLDENLVGLGLSLPHRLKTDGRTGKMVPRALARRWLPRAVARHRKHGFTIPLDVMLPHGFHDVLQDFLLGPGARTATCLNGALVRQWLTAFRAARAAPRGGAISRSGLYQRVFMLLSLEVWLRDHGLAW